MYSGLTTRQVRTCGWICPPSLNPARDVSRSSEEGGEALTAPEVKAPHQVTHKTVIVFQTDSQARAADTASLINPTDTAFQTADPSLPHPGSGSPCRTTVSDSAAEVSE